MDVFLLGRYRAAFVYIPISVRRSSKRPVPTRLPARVQHNQSSSGKAYGYLALFHWRPGLHVGVIVRVYANLFGSGG